MALAIEIASSWGEQAGFSLLQSIRLDNLNAAGADLLPQVDQAAQGRRQDAHHLGQSLQLLGISSAAAASKILAVLAPVVQGAVAALGERLQGGGSDVQVVAGIGHLHRVPLLGLLLPGKLETGIPSLAASRDHRGALLGQAGMELEEAGAGHGIVDDALVPEQGGEDRTDALGKGGGMARLMGPMERPPPLRLADAEVVASWSSLCCSPCCVVVVVICRRLRSSSRPLSWAGSEPRALFLGVCLGVESRAAVWLAE